MTEAASCNRTLAALTGWRRQRHESPHPDCACGYRLVTSGTWWLRQGFGRDMDPYFARLERGLLTPLDVLPSPVVLGRFEAVGAVIPGERGQDPEGTVRCARVRLLPGPVFLAAPFEDQWRQVQRALPTGCEIFIVDSLRDVTEDDFEERAR